jgi:hypothetical protein
MGAAEVELHSLVTLAVEGVEWSGSYTGFCTPENCHLLIAFEVGKGYYVY